MEVRTFGDHGLAPGDEVSCVGFPLLAELKPVLLDADLRKEGRSVLPQALEIAAPDVLSAPVNGLD